ncbi:MAG TPA: DUF4097 family beta strand repeat-containing protein [Terriglobales bacterium]|nr:DUF4097 family beta strand repeat-containing protein [Terriglobales bacterium]
MQRSAIAGLVVAACIVTAVSAETRKEFRFTVGPKANIVVDNEYGGITVKPGNANQVLVVAVIHSDKVEVDNSHEGDRLEIESHLLSGADAKSGRVDYELTVPPNVPLSLRSSTGPLSVERTQGDLTLEGADAEVNVRNVSHCHVHVKTMRGNINLTEIRDGHIEINSISGEVHLNAVDGPHVQVESGTGKVFYDGDFGSSGTYAFTTHTGDIEALIAPDASADFSARSMQGSVKSDVPLKPKEHNRFPTELGRSFFGTMGKAASEVILKSISGTIHLRQR